MSGVALDYFVVVPVTNQGDPTRVTGVYRAEDRMLTSRAKPVIKLADREQTAVVVGLTRAQLLLIHPGFDRARDMDLAIALGTPPTSPQVRMSSNLGLVDAPLPPDAAMIAATSGTGAPSEDLRRRVMTRLVLTLPVDPEYCRLGLPGTFSAFGDVPVLLPDSKPIPGEPEASGGTSQWRKANKVIAVDRDRALMLTSKMVYLVHRGRPIAVPSSRSDFDHPMTPSDALWLDRIATDYPLAEAMLLDSAHPRPDGSIPILIGGAINTASDRARVWELALSNDGVRYVETASITWRARPSADFIRDLAIDSTGAVIGVGDPGAVIVRAPGSREFVAMPRIDGTDPQAFFRRVAATGIPQKPHLIASDEGKLYLGDARRGDWSIFKRTDRFNTLRFDGLAIAPDEMWAVGHIGTLFRRIGAEDWTRIQLTIPPRFYPCTANSGTDASSTLVSNVRDVAIDEKNVYLVMDNCTAVLRVRRSDLCASVITHPMAPIATTNFDHTSASLLDGVLIVGGVAGTLLRLAL